MLEDKGNTAVYLLYANTRIRSVKHVAVIVTYYEKIDHLQFSIKTEFLAWIDSPMCAESYGASFMKKY